MRIISTRKNIGYKDKAFQDVPLDYPQCTPYILLHYKLQNTDAMHINELNSNHNKILYPIINRPLG